MKLTKKQALRLSIDKFLKDKDDFWYFDMLEELGIEHETRDSNYAQEYFKILIKEGVVAVCTVKGNSKKYLVL